MPTAGVTVVGTFPTHRRRGVLRSMMRAQLDDVHERGEPIALLWASEETIYGRFGYGMASHRGRGLDSRREYSAFARPLEREGTLRIVDADEALTLFPRVWNAVRRAHPRHARAHAQLVGAPHPLRAVPAAGTRAGPKRFVVLEQDGRPEGYAIYRHKPKWEDGVSNSELEVVEAVALDGRPTAELWRYLLDIDWAARIDGVASCRSTIRCSSCSRRRGACGSGSSTGSGCGSSTSAPRSRRAAMRRTARSSSTSSTSSARGTRAAGGSSDGRAKRTTASPQLRCDVTALGSAYLGGFSFSELVRGGRVEELRRGAAARADAMFASDRAPWCPEIF